MSQPHGTSGDHSEVADATHEPQDSNVELQEMITGKPRLPIEDDIMQLARLGEISAIQSLFNSGKFTPTYTDEQGITPLHVSCAELDA